MKSVLTLLLCAFLIQVEVRCVSFETGDDIPDGGLDYTPDGKIWNNGNLAAQGQFPWQVAINLLNSNVTTLPFCSGALISPDWVLTAAKCVQGVGNLELRFGTTNIGSNEQIQYSQEYIIHPFYSESVLGGEKMSRNNIALIALGTSVTITDTVYPIGVANFSMGMTVARFAGWGRTQGSTGLSLTLNYANMLVTSNTLCQWSFKSAIESIHLCTSGSSPRKSGTCDGDTGGALTVFRDDNWYMIGIAIIVNDTCDFTTPSPSVYTRVSPYYAWIENTTRLNLTLGGTTLPPFTSTTADPGAGTQIIPSIGYIFMVVFYAMAWLIRQ